MSTGPNYPQYPSTILTGDLPSPAAMGPWDMYPSSSTAPYYQRRLDSMYGRHLAGAEKPVGSDEEPAYALNELKLMAEMDDTQGAGVFDPPGSRPNIYPDAGILASAYSLPGYLARERMYAPSEVVDSNTGRRVVYVNGGTVSMDSTAQIAFLEGGRYAPPRPYLNQYSERDTPMESTVNVRQNPVPVTVQGPPAMGDGEQVASTGMSPAGKMIVALGVAGVGVGVLYALTRPKMASNRRRRRR